MNLKVLRVLGVVGVCAVLVSLFSASCSRSRRNLVTLAGSTAFQPFAEKLAEIYLAENQGVQVNVQGGGSAVGIQSALSGTADIGMADLLSLPDTAKSLTQIVVARDGIAIVVNPKNSVTSLSAEQAKDVFSGKINNWKDLGGDFAGIMVISREEGSGTRRSFDKLVLGAERITENALFQDSNGTVREAVASDPNAIGYVSIGLVNDAVKAVKYAGVNPSHENVKKGSYPLARPVYFLTKPEVKPQVKAFIDFVMSPKSQSVLEKEGLVSAK